MITDRVNRALLIVIGLMLALAGGLVLVLGSGATGSVLSDRRVLNQDTRAQLSNLDTWVWILIAVGGVLLVIGGLFWLWLQFKVDRITHVGLEPDGAAGHLQLSSSALTGVIETEAEDEPGVQKAHARLVSRHGQTHLHLTVRINPHIDMYDARRHLETVVLDRARQAVQPDTLPTRLRLDIARSGGRVR